MSFVAVAIGGAAVVGGVTSVISGNKAANAAKDAAATSAATDKYIFDQTRSDNAPWRAVGTGALGKLAALYGVTPAGNMGGDSVVNAAFGPSGDWTSYLDQNPDVRKGWADLTDKADFQTPEAYARWHYQKYGAAEGRALPGAQTGASSAGGQFGDFIASPGYQFRMDQGLKAIERSAAARGGLRSGATMKSLNDYAQGTASDEFARYVGGLQSLAGVGQSANAANQKAGQTYATNVGNATMAAGNARASAYANTGSAINQTVGNLASAYLYNKGYGAGVAPTVTPAPSYYRA